MKSPATISNTAMLTVALVTIPAEFVAMTIYSRTQDSSGYIVGNLQAGVRGLAVLGILGSITVLTTVLLGLNYEPRKKISGTVACIIVLGIVLSQAVYFTIGWIKYG